MAEWCGHRSAAEWAHIDPSIAQNYVHLREAGVEVVRRSDFNSFESGKHLIVLAPIYLNVAYQLFAPLLGEASHQPFARMASTVARACKE